jgi:hypothetical protein
VRRPREEGLLTGRHLVQGVRLLQERLTRVVVLDHSGELRRGHPQLVVDQLELQQLGLLEFVLRTRGRDDVEFVELGLSLTVRE